ncbi:MAG: LysR family transcriptional regulator [Bryobacteraceae bacterium]
MVDLHYLKTFVEVVATNSFTAAAINLGCSQSTVTFHIKALEREIGVDLLDRFRFARTISLTEAGRRVHGTALRLLALAEEIKPAIPKMPRAQR